MIGSSGIDTLPLGRPLRFLPKGPKFYRTFAKYVTHGKFMKFTNTTRTKFKMYDIEKWWYLKYFYRYTWFDVGFGGKISRIHLPDQWKAKYSTNFGLCYSYSIPKYLKDAEVRDITFYIKNSIDFYLSHPGQFLSWQVHSFPTRSKQQVYVETSHEVIFIYNKCDFDVDYFVPN